MPQTHTGSGVSVGHLIKMSNTTSHPLSSANRYAYTGRADGDESNSVTTCHGVVSFRTGKAMWQKVPRGGGKVIVNIGDTTYFMSRKRWRLLHKQWYVLIHYIL